MDHLGTLPTSCYNIHGSRVAEEQQQFRRGGQVAPKDLLTLLKQVITVPLSNTVHETLEAIDSQSQGYRRSAAATLTFLLKSK